MSESKKSNFILPAIFIGATVLVGYLGWIKYCDTAQLPTYSKSHILSNVKKNKNVPLAEELFVLGDSVKDVLTARPGSVSDPKKRSKLILLNKVCKDSCKAIRCRVDPGLGHACRQNCHPKKVRSCILAAVRLPDEGKDIKHGNIKK